MKRALALVTAALLATLVVAEAGHAQARRRGKPKQEKDLEANLAHDRSKVGLDVALTVSIGL